ncbi:hypothetical protein pkur_cds_67 [Pandoravirus kuranda]|uniref:Uncharacterized protein n=1 Tax=Pandoravirus kuranda TaxID=3019033 RepID=A0AA95ECJ4_9VIRU|nr:hypothetical protein pkur_cds_67 [Pandoravirus kuranda]
MTSLCTLDRDDGEGYGGGDKPSPQSEALSRSGRPKRKTLDSRPPASSAPSNEPDGDGVGEPRLKRQRLKTTDAGNGAAGASGDHASDGDARERRAASERERAPAPYDPSESMVAEWDCADLSVVRRWMRRMRKRFEAARCDAVWWERAASALRPMPPDAGGGLLLVSAILRGRPFATSYEDLVKDVPDAVLGAVAWRGTRLIFGLCVHPDGCGPVASRPEGTPAHPHAERVLRLALSLPLDHEDRDTDGNCIFTVDQVVHTVSDLCSGKMAGRRLARFARLLARWYANAYAHWGEARESIECFIERRVLLTARTGCTAADLVAGRLRPCDWLCGAPGPTLDACRSPVAHRSGDGDKRVLLPDTTQRPPQGDGNMLQHDGAQADNDNKAPTIDVDESDVVSSNAKGQDQGAAEYRSDLEDAQRRRREAPSLRCVYDRVVCKQPQEGRGLPCLYIQSRLCAAEDRPGA